MDSFESLLETLQQRGIRLLLEDGRLRVQAPKGAMDERLQAMLRLHKPALMDRLGQPGIAEPGSQGLVRKHGLSRYPLSPAQKRLWFLQQLEPQSTRYHEAAALRLDGRLDPQRLQELLCRWVERHEILRTSFHYHHGELYQQVHELMPVSLRRGPVSELRACVLDPFDLGQAPLFRVGLLDDGEASVLVLVFHHLITDFWSAGLALAEIRALWQGETLPDPPLQYGDYALWQDSRPLNQAALDYWLGQLADLPLGLDLGRSATSGQSHGGDLIEVVLPEALVAQWEGLARQHKVTRFAWLLSAWQAFLGRWFQLEAGVVAFPSAGRPAKQLETLLGCFVTTQLMAFRSLPGQSFAAWLQSRQTQLIAALDHGDLPFESLISRLQPPRDLPYFPQLGIVMQDSWQTGLSLGELAAEWVELDFLEPKFELLLAWLGFRGSLRLTFDPGLHERAVMASLLQHFVGFFARTLADPQQPLARIPLTPDKTLFRPAAECPVDAWIHQRVETIAAHLPESIALRWHGEPLSYAALNARANRWARALGARGIGRGDRVAVRLRVSPELIVALLAILKAGAAYVPIDEDSPALRSEALLADCRPALMIAESGWESEKLLIPEALDAAGSELNEANLGLDVAASDLAYIIYTSGSTGLPNGVCITHANVARLFPAVARGFAMPGDDVWLLFHSVAFDYSVWEIWGCLASGSTLVLLDRGSARDPDAVWRLIKAEGVTVLSQTPSAFRYLSRVACADVADVANLAGLRLRALILSGEKLELAWLRDWFERFGERVELINSYGITETTVFVTWRRILAADLAHGRSVIGPPLPDLDLAVLDANLEPVAPGMSGELCVLGPGLSPGYWQRSELSAGRFRDLPAGRIYRSGDLARRDPDGEIVYLGRRDLQIKLRGYRIESGEVQAALERQPEVQAAWVSLWEAPAGPQLLAWVIPAEPLDPAGLHARLATLLPPPMLPARILSVGAFPLNQNGKVDTPTLIATLVAALKSEREQGEPLAQPATGSGLEAELAAILARLLDRPTIGPDENFFALGGHSLLMVEAREQIQALTGTPVELVDLFHYPTLRQLAAHLQPEAQAWPAATSLPAPLATAEIAIIGMALRLPGADSPAELWQNLLAGSESIRFWSEQELRDAGVPAADYGHRDYVPACGWLEGIEDFDAGFFGFSPREAELLDPQQRLMLELAWEACDSAGYGDHRQAQCVGVFAGGGISRYLLFHLARQPLLASINPMQILIANDKDYLATRVAHRLNLTGPALSVQSACSSSLAAVHLACESLRAGECEMALAGGVTLETRPQGYRWLDGAIYSRDGHCRPFAADATGIVGGSGAAWVLLKPLEKALADGDLIYAVIKGSALNNDGADKAGYLAPGVEGQRQVITRALQRAGVSPEAIGVVEAHGTGTAIGDPIEVRALSLAWRAWTQARGFCALGSLKGNLGHLDAAAGVAGLIKAALMLHHGRIAPTINVSEPNPALQLEASPFYLPRAPVAWTGPGRHAAVSSLGIGGTNVHLILAAAPEVQPQAVTILEQEPLVAPFLLPVSAPTEESFARLSQALADVIGTPPSDGLPERVLSDLALTLQRGRQPFAWRGAVMAGERSEVAARLRSLVPQQGRTLPPLVFLCPGLGSQQPMMGAALWPVWPAYRAAIADCARILADCWPHDLVSLLLEAHLPEFLAQPLIMQPLIFCHGYALARGWMDLGLQPAALLGHSFGEYLAATLAGSASLEQMLPLIVKRGELFAQLTGAVLGVAADPDRLELPPGISLASVNGPDRLTLSGPRSELEAFARAASVSVRWLDVPHAVHHPLLDEILTPLERAAAAVSWQAPRLRLLSGLSGHWQQDAPAAGYWVRQARQPIRFDACLQTLADQGSWLGLELGPGTGLAGLCRGRGLTAFGGSQDLAGFWRILAGLWELGAAPRWEALEVPGRRIPLPGTPLTRQRHWIPAGDPAPVLPSGRLPFDDWFRVPLWRRSLLPGRSKGVWAMLPQGESELSTLPSTLVLPCLEMACYEQATVAFLDLRAQVLKLVMAGWPQGGRGQLVLLTSPFSRVTGDESLSPWPALLLGLVRTLALEFPGLSARLVESDSGLALPTGEWLQPEAHVAWRNGMRWLPELMAVPRPDPVSDPASDATSNLAGPLKNRGVYLITGASGGLGRSFAAWLKQRFQARLVLLSRTPPPDAPDTLPLAVDMCNPEQVRAALATAGAYFGGIDGIIHAAAEPGHHLLASLGSAELHQTLDAKVLGTVHLQQALDTLGLEPDFVLLCSALATQLGSPGQSAYTAANAWLEAFAQQQAGPWMAVAWGSWQQLGMAARALQNLPEAWQPLYRPFLELGIDPKQGCLALERALQLAQTQLIVSPVAIAELAGLQQQALAAARRPPLQRAESPSPPRATVPTAELPRPGIETLIAGVWEQCLGLTPGRQDHFAALGGDSLSAVQMKALLEQALGQELPLGLFLQDLSLSALAASLADGTPPSEDLLIRLNGVERGDPLFFVHAISGTVFPYRGLADSLQRPFYGLQSRGLLGSDNLPHDELGAMARDYLCLIESVETLETGAQPPYTLGGWSFGALVAWEMARQCLARGRSVKRLILLDMQAPEPGQALDEGGLRERFEADLTGLGPAAGRMRDRLWLIFEAHVRATQTFRPEVLDVPALLLVAEKGFGATHARRDLGWGRWLPQLEVVRIPGDHYSCLDALNLAQWPARLDDL